MPQDRAIAGPPEGRVVVRTKSRHGIGFGIGEFGDFVVGMARDVVGHRPRIEPAARQLRALGKRLGLGEDLIGDRDGDFHTFGMPGWSGVAMRGIIADVTPEL